MKRRCKSFALFLLTCAAATAILAGATWLLIFSNEWSWRQDTAALEWADPGDQ